MWSYLPDVHGRVWVWVGGETESKAARALEGLNLRAAGSQGSAVRCGASSWRVPGWYMEGWQSAAGAGGRRWALRWEVPWVRAQGGSWWTIFRNVVAKGVGSVGPPHFTLFFPPGFRASA